ncbi:MAG: DUF6666 family protein [Pirellulales bacterium]
MFLARLTARRFQLSTLALGTAWALTAITQTAAADDEWRASGITRPRTAQSTSAATSGDANQAWRLPNNQQPAATADSRDDDASNPLRQKPVPKSTSSPVSNKPQSRTAAQEPRAFQPPTGAQRIASNQSAATSAPQQPVQRPAANATAKAPAASTFNPHNNSNNAVRPAYAQAPQRPNHQQRPQSTNARRNEVNYASGGFWDTINVAFQGEAPQKSVVTETLPSPNNRADMQDPVMKHFDGPGAFIGPYQPYDDGGPGCVDGSCPCDGPCNGGCPCGEPGCSCEPGCGCEAGCTCNDCCCGDDLFCLGPGDPEACHTVRVRVPKWQEVMVFGGVQGFKSPYDQNRDSGNFGFNQGFNIGAKVPYAALGYQFGWRGTQNQLNGDENTGTPDQHFQQFATAGLFHRQPLGLNFGAVWDVLHDERFGSENFHQMRSELSLRDGGCHEFGASATFGMNNHGFDDGNDGTYEFRASDQFYLFYRYHGVAGGEGRIFAGCNDDSDGIFGADVFIPVGDRFSVQSGFEYLIPNEKDGVAGASSEAWNVGVGLVWHWDCQARKCHDNCYRPLFDVANNGSLIVDRRSHNVAASTSAPLPSANNIDTD